MSRPIILAAAMASLLVARAAVAQQPADPHAVQPERPTVATHAYAVAPGWIELEIGAERDRDNPGSYAMAFVTTAKLGLARGIQLNVTQPLLHPIGLTGGLGDLSAAVKWRLLAHAPVVHDVAIMPGIKAPTASVASGHGTGTWDVSLLLISSRQIGPVAVDINAGLTRRSGDGSVAPRWASLWTVSSGGPLVGSLGWVLECYGYPGTAGPAGQAPTVALLAGPTVTARRWLAFDVGVIMPLSGPQPRALYAGAVINVGRLWGRARSPSIR